MISETTFQAAHNDVILHNTCSTYYKINSELVHLEGPNVLFENSDIHSLQCNTGECQNFKIAQQAHLDRLM